MQIQKFMHIREGGGGGNSEGIVVYVSHPTS